MFGIGGFELFLILLFGFLIFGPDKLPQIANTIGRAIAKFRTAQEEMSGKLKAESFMDKDSDEPFKNPLEVIEHNAAKSKDAAEEAASKMQEATDKVVQHSESFAERKARYDRERKERQEAAAREAEMQSGKTNDVQADPRSEVRAKTVRDASLDTGAEEDAEVSE